MFSGSCRNKGYTDGGDRGIGKTKLSCQYRQSFKGRLD